MNFFIALCLVIFICCPLTALPYSVFEEGGKVGLKDQGGEVVIPPAYESLGWAEGEFSLVGNVTGYKLDGHWGLINLSNQRLTPAEYTALRKGNNSMIIASKQSPLTFRTTTGCLNESGKVIIPLDYTGIDLTELRAIVFIRDGGVFKYGVVDFQNKVRIQIKYKGIIPLGSLRFEVEDFEGKIAIYSETGKAITPFDIDHISPFKNNHAIFTQNGLKGLINREGVIVYPAEYTEIEISPNPRGKKLNEWSVLTCDNSLEKTLYADSILQVDKTRYKMVHGELVKLTTETFEQVGTQLYNQVFPFERGVAIARSSGKLGVIDGSGNRKVPFAYDDITLDEHHAFTGKISGNQSAWEIYDLSGNRISKRHYEQIEPFNGHFFPAKKNGFWGGVDRLGNEILGCVYDEILECRFQRVVVKFKGLYGVINLDENWIIAPQKNKITLISESRYLAQSDDLLYLKAYDNFVYYFTSNPIEVTPEGLVEKTTIGAIWTINYDGQIIRRQEAYREPVEKVFPETEGLRGIKKDNRYGFIDDRARLRIANRYEGIKPFSEGLAAIKILGKWGFINHEEKIIAQPIYDDVAPFTEGYSIVKQNGACGLINTEGQLILPIRYQSIKVLPTGRLLLTLNKLKGLADEKGIMLIQCKYERIIDLENQYAIVQLHGKYGVVKQNGVSTIPQQYDYMFYNPEAGRVLALRKSDWVDLPLE